MKVLLLTEQFILVKKVITLGRKFPLKNSVLAENRFFFFNFSFFDEKSEFSMVRQENSK